jgi:TPR repeat protein
MKIIFSLLFSLFVSINSYAVDVDLGYEFYEKGNYKEALTLWEKTCKEISEGCSYLGILYYEGNGVKKDYLKAIELFSKACDKNDSLGCYSLGFSYESGNGVEQNYSKAIEYYNKSCELKDENGCYNIALLYEKKSKEFYKKGCNLYKDGISCKKYNYLNEIDKLFE